MNIVFITNGGDIREIGSGHLYRSLYIAQLFKKKNKNNIIKFFTKKNVINKYGDSLLSKNKIENINKRKNYNKTYTYNKVIKNKPDLIIFDTLGADINLVKLFNNKNIKIISFDDDSKSYLYVNYIINGLINTKYKSNNILSGFKNLIIQSDFEKIKTVKKNIKNIFIYFGYHDHKNLLLKIFPILLKLKDKYQISILYNNNNIKFNKYLIKNNYSKIKNINFIKQNSNIIKLLKKFDFAICSGGLLMFQCCSIGLPFFPIPQYRHQIINIKNLKKNKIFIPNDNFFCNQKFLEFKILAMINNKQYRLKQSILSPIIISKENNYKTINFIYNLIGR